MDEVDFDIEFTDDGMRIQFKLIDSLFFVANAMFDGASVRMAPGEYKTLDDRILVTDQSVIDEFNYWVTRVATELRAQPAMREVEKNRARIDELEARLTDVEDTYFTKDEALHFSRRLDMIEAELRHMASERATPESLAQNLENVASAIDIAKSLISSAKRSVILRFILRRLVAGLDDSVPELVGRVAGQLTEGSNK